MGVVLSLFSLNTNKSEIKTLARGTHLPAVVILTSQLFSPFRYVTLRNGALVPGSISMLTKVERISKN